MMLGALIILLAGFGGYYFGYNNCKSEYEQYLKEIHDIYLSKLVKDDGE